MKRILLIIFVALWASGFTSQRKFLELKNSSFYRGEKLTYRLHYGIFNAGIGEVEVLPKLYRVNDEICYKYRIIGKSTGAFAAILKIEDTWISYADTSTLLPQMSFRDIKEGKYVYKEKVLFDQTDTIAKVEFAKSDGKKHHREYPAAQYIHDIVSGFYFIRNIDYDKLKMDEIIEVWAFFDDDYYKFQIRYKGKDVVKTDIGKVNAVRLVPIMPENELFDGEDSIELWISDDKNRIPLKCRAEMFVGAVELDLKKAENLRGKLNRH